MNIQYKVSADHAQVQITSGTTSFEVINRKGESVAGNTTHSDLCRGEAIRRLDLAVAGRSREVKLAERGNPTVAQYEEAMRQLVRESREKMWTDAEIDLRAKSIARCEEETAVPFAEWMGKAKMMTAGEASGTIGYNVDHPAMVWPESGNHIEWLGAQGKWYLLIERDEYLVGPEKFLQVCGMLRAWDLMERGGWTEDRAAQVLETLRLQIEEYAALSVDLSEWVSRWVGGAS